MCWWRSKIRHWGKDGRLQEAPGTSFMLSSLASSPSRTIPPHRAGHRQPLVRLIPSSKFSLQWELVSSEFTIYTHLWYHGRHTFYSRCQDADLIILEKEREKEGELEGYSTFNTFWVTLKYPFKKVCKGMRKIKPHFWNCLLFSYLEKKTKPKEKKSHFGFDFQKSSEVLKKSSFSLVWENLLEKLHKWMKETPYRVN